MVEDTAHTYWERSDAFDMALTLPRDNPDWQSSVKR